MSVDLTRIADSLPAHYFDCDRFEVYDYGIRQGECDCTATADIRALLALAEPNAEPSDRDVLAATLREVLDAIATGGTCHMARWLTTLAEHGGIPPQPTEPKDTNRP